MFDLPWDLQAIIEIFNDANTNKNLIIQTYCFAFTATDLGRVLEVFCTFQVVNLTEWSTYIYQNKP